MSLPRHQKGTTYALLLAILLVGTTLRFYDLGGKSLRGDERVTVIQSQRLGPILESSPGQPFWSHEPVLYLCTFATLQIGQGEWWVRLPVALAGILAIAALYKLGDRLFGPREGAISAALLAASPVHIWYAQDARKYSLLILLALLTLLTIERALRTGSGRAWLAFAIASILNLATHSLAILVSLVQGLWVGTVLLLQVRSTKHYKRHWLSLGLCALIIGLLFLPRQIAVLQTNVLEDTPEAAEETALAAVHLDDRARWTGEVFEQAFLEFAGNNWTTLYLSLGLIGLALVEALSQRRDVALLAVLWIGLPMGILLGLQPRHIPATRFLSFWLPVYLLMVSRGVAVLVQHAECLVARSGREWGHTIRWTGSAAIVLCLVLSGQPAIAEYYAQEKQDWRGVGAILSTSARPDEVVVVKRNRALDSLNDYAPGLPNLQVVNTQAELQALYEAHEGLWFVRWWSPAEGNERLANQWLRNQEFATLPLRGSWSPMLISYRRKDISAADSKIRLYKTAVELYPERASFRIALGDAYRENEMWQAAIAQYDKALNIDPSLADAHVGLGLVWQAQDRPHDAIAAYQRATKLAPHHGKAFRLLGDAYSADGQAEQAVAAYEQAVTIDPGFAEKTWFHLRLGQAAYDAGSFDTARQAFEQVLQLDPNNAAAQEYLTRMQP